MKKFLLAAFLGLTIVFVNVQAQAAVPEQNTWVMTWEVAGVKYDYYVVAGSLEYVPNEGAPAEFSCDVTHVDIVHHYEFKSVGNGWHDLYVDGEKYGDTARSKFVRAIYEAICNKLIYTNE